MSNRTTADDSLIFSGTNTSYTATDDLTGIIVKSVTYNNSATALQTTTGVLNFNGGTLAAAASDSPVTAPL